MARTQFIRRLVGASGILFLFVLSSATRRRRRLILTVPHCLTDKSLMEDYSYERRSLNLALNLMVSKAETRLQGNHPFGRGKGAVPINYMCNWKRNGSQGYVCACAYRILRRVTHAHLLQTCHSNTLLS